MMTCAMLKVLRQCKFLLYINNGIVIFIDKEIILKMSEIDKAQLRC